MKLFTALAVSALALSAQANAAIVFTDGFEAEAEALTVTNLTNFTVTSGVSVDIVGTATDQGYGMNVTSNVVDMDGTPGPATLTSKASFGFLAGSTVTLTFDLSGSQRSAASDGFSFAFLFDDATDVSNWGVDFGSGPFNIGSASAAPSLAVLTSVPGGDPFDTFSLFFTAAEAGSVKLAFTTDSADNAGPLLDNVSLDVTNPVPEPATWAMMIGGFAIAGLSMRRRKTAISFA